MGVIDDTIIENRKKDVIRRENNIKIYISIFCAFCILVFIGFFSYMCYWEFQDNFPSNAANFHRSMLGFFVCMVLYFCAIKLTNEKYSIRVENIKIKQDTYENNYKLLVKKYAEAYPNIK